MRVPKAAVLMVIAAAVTCSCGSGSAVPSGSAPPTTGAEPSATVVQEEPSAATSPPAIPTATAPPTATPPPPAATPTSRPTSPSPSPASDPAAPSSGPAQVRAGCLENAARDVFVGEVLTAIRDRDRAAIRESMAASFYYMVEATDVFLPPASARTAARQLFTGVPDPDGNHWFTPVGRPRRVRCVDAFRPRDLGESRGFWPTQWDVAVEVTGLGAAGDATGWLMIGTNGAGEPVWRGLLFGFPGVDLWD